MEKIVAVKGIELLDSRGNPTVGAQVVLSDNSCGFAISPSGASTGAYEAFELRDKDPSRYFGKGTSQAVHNINEVIAPLLCKSNACCQQDIDRLMIAADGTANKHKLGANAILAVSMAVARAYAASQSVPLYRYLGGAAKVKMPIPMMNILNGGAHAANNVDIQEFMIVLRGCESFAEVMQCGSEIYHTLGKLLAEQGLLSGVGDEGGFAPNIASDEAALDLICTAIKQSGYSDDRVGLALDVAASEWYKEDCYYLPKRGEMADRAAMIARMQQLCQNYPIISIEDPLGEDDWQGWQQLTAELGNKIQLVGDDLFVTNTERLQMGIDQKVANAILIKPNQIGTVTETLDVIGLARKNGYKVVISHRSGETEDTFIADLAVAVSADMIKSGAPCRTDRVAKYNRLLAIENSLKD